MKTNNNNMKINNYSLKVVDMNKVQLSMKDLYARTEKEVNDFLKTRKGLAYLRMKYPNLSAVDAIKEYKTSAYQALNY